MTNCGLISLGGLRNDYDAYRLGYCGFAARDDRGFRHQMGRWPMTESEKGMIAAIFAIIATTVPLAAVAILVSAYALFFV